MNKHGLIIILVLTIILSSCNLKKYENPFVNVNQQLVDKIHETNQKITTESANLDKKYKINTSKLKPIYDKFNQIQIVSNALIAQLDSLRFGMISFSEGISLNEAKKISVSDLKELDNFEIPTNYLFGNAENVSNSRAKELKNWINDYRQKLSEIMGKDSVQISKDLNTKDRFNRYERKPCTWEFNNFHKTMLGGSITIFSKLILDIRNAEYDCLKKLNSNI